MEFKIRPQLADDADSCPNCGEEVQPRHIFQLGSATEVVDLDETFFHTKCPDCDVMWDEYYGWD